MKELFALCSIILLIQCHRCIHDQVIRNKKLIVINDTTTSRRLQSSEYGPIRFHLEYNTSTINNTTILGQNIIKMMNILTLYWSKTLEVYYLPALSFNSNDSIPKCLDFVIPRDIISTPILNVDYGVLVEAKDDGESGTTAYSYPCAYSLTTKQPLWGLLHWNINYLTFDLLSFQMNIKIGIHESTHLLGFSNILYPNFVYGKLITNSMGSFINGSFMQKAIRDQFACTNSSGMPLEMNGGSGTSMSHWSYKSSFNEYMTAGVMPNNPTISYITHALLQETGWYKTVRKQYGQFLNWGYQKGCKMLNQNDCNSDQYCTNVGVKGCDYDQTALGYCKNQVLSNCLIVQYYSNYICVDPNFLVNSLNGNISSITGQVGGQFSRCFDSTLVVKGANATKYPFRCYKTICSATGRTLTVQVGNAYALCLFPRQNITVAGYSGVLTCPKSFSKICAQKRCPSECNGNGVCLKGKCLCQAGFTGQSCSQVTSIGFASQAPIFMAQNNNNCFAGSFLSIFGDCQPCSVTNCLICNMNGCQVCLDGGLPSNIGACSMNKS